MATEIILTKDTPARVLGVPITIDAGTRLITYGPVIENAGGVDICRAWAPQSENGGPAALVPFVIFAGYLNDAKFSARLPLQNPEQESEEKK